MATRSPSGTRSLSGARTQVSRINNIIYNGDFEISPLFVAATNTNQRWIDGTAAGSAVLLTAYHWAVPSLGITASAETAFDNSVSHSGTNSLRLSTLNTSGTVVVSSYRNATIDPRELFQLLPNIQYKLSCYIKTNNVVSNGAFIDLREYNSAKSVVTTTSSNKLSGTNNFTLVSATVTTNASTVFGSIILRVPTAGNISNAWFDDIILFPTNFNRTLI
jgi:hypothetical protein